MTSPEITDAAAALAREYRPSMYIDVLHSWAADVVALLNRLPAALAAGGAPAPAALVAEPVACAPGDPAFENAIEDAAKAAFTKAQSVYRKDHDHFPIRNTWGTATESVRDGWRSIAYAAVEAATTPPLGTQPEPRRSRALRFEAGDALVAEPGEPVALLPCPFCGGTNLKSGGDDKIVGTWCLTCEASGPNEYGKFAWNRRAAPPARQDGALREALELLRRGRQKLATYTDIYAGDKELRRLLTDWDAALAQSAPVKEGE